MYKCINKNIYVDDILDSVDTQEEAKLLTMNIETVLEKGNFKVKD